MKLEKIHVGGIEKKPTNHLEISVQKYFPDKFLFQCLHECLLTIWTR